MGQIRCEKADRFEDGHQYDEDGDCHECALEEMASAYLKAAGELTRARRAVFHLLSHIGKAPECCGPLLSRIRELQPWEERAPAHYHYDAPPGHPELRGRPCTNPQCPDWLPRVEDTSRG